MKNSSKDMNGKRRKLSQNTVSYIKAPKPSISPAKKALMFSLKQIQSSKMKYGSKEGETTHSSKSNITNNSISNNQPSYFNSSSTSPWNSRRG
jgi:hypothetical protein